LARWWLDEADRRPQTADGAAVGGSAASQENGNATTRLRRSAVAEAKAEAKQHAEIAKERAWCDGPPHCCKPALDEAERMLKEI